MPLQNQAQSCQSILFIADGHNKANVDAEQSWVGANTRLMGWGGKSSLKSQLWCSPAVTMHRSFLCIGLLTTKLLQFYPILIMTVPFNGTFSAACKSFYFSLVSISWWLVFFFYLPTRRPPCETTTLSSSFSYNWGSWKSHFMLMSLLLSHPTHCSSLCSLVSAISPSLTLRLPTVFLSPDLSSHFVPLLHKSVFTFVFCDTTPGFPCPSKWCF